MSVQLDRYLSCRAEGLSREDAAFEAGLSLEEARLTDIANDRGEIAAPPSTAKEAAAPTTKRSDQMAGKAQQQDSVEIKEPDFERAVKIYRQDIKPANEKSGEHAQAASTAYKAIKKECRVNGRAAKFVFQLSGESEEKRNDILRSIRGLLKAMNIGITDDLVSQAENEDSDAPIIPTAVAQERELVTVN